MLQKLFSMMALLALLLARPAFAERFNHAEVDELLAGAEAPAGVVFETLSWDQQAWQKAAPLIADLRRQLRAKFPDIDVVIVSHGADQFQLTREREQEQPEAMAQLASLANEGVNIHVCGVHGQWNSVPEDAYLDFVDVSASGPAQINDYVNMGYKKILLRGDD